VSDCTVWLKTLNLELIGGTLQHIILFLCLFILFLFSFVTLVFCFSGTTVLEFKFGEECFESNLSRQFHLSPG
jgi:hypothetical protein